MLIVSYETLLNNLLFCSEWASRIVVLFLISALDVENGALSIGEHGGVYCIGDSFASVSPGLHLAALTLCPCAQSI